MDNQLLGLILIASATVVGLLYFGILSDLSQLLFGSTAKRAWELDRLGVLGVGSAIVAFLLWAWEYQGAGGVSSGWFSTERLPAIGAFVVLGAFLLLLRRR